MQTLERVIAETVSSEQLRAEVENFERLAGFSTADLFQRVEAGETFDTLEFAGEWYMLAKIVRDSEACDDHDREHIPAWIELDEEAPKGACFFLWTNGCHPAK